MRKYFSYKKLTYSFQFLQIQDRDYINVILAIYEFNDVSFMKDLFVNNYLINIKRYS